ncbi:MAG: hypothetical protein QME41_03710 [Actinomycetota bacterium]|nr:hypothetical protein [Actinomycetota bacterium]
MHSKKQLLVALLSLAVIAGIMTTALTFISGQPAKATDIAISEGSAGHDPSEVATKAILPTNVLKPTGGPFKKKEDMIAKAKDPKVSLDTKFSGREEAFLMTNGEFRNSQARLTGHKIADNDIDDNKEIWVVVVGGDFDQTWRSSPGDDHDYASTKWLIITYDAATGDPVGLSTGPGVWPDAFINEAKYHQLQAK